MINVKKFIFFFQRWPITEFLFLGCSPIKFARSHSLKYFLIKFLFSIDSFHLGNMKIALLKWFIESGLWIESANTRLRSYGQMIWKIFPGIHLVFDSSMHQFSNKNPSLMYIIKLTWTFYKNEQFRKFQACTIIGFEHEKPYSGFKGIPKNRLFVYIRCIWRFISHKYFSMCEFSTMHTR